MVCTYFFLSFLGSMLPQYMAFSVSFVCRKKFVCPFFGLHCGCAPPCENMCVRSLGYIVGASPPLWKYVCPSVGFHCGCVPPYLKICVSVHWVTFWVRSPLVCVLSLKDNLRWILACCLLRFAAIFGTRNVYGHCINNLLWYWLWIFGLMQEEKRWYKNINTTLLIFIVIVGAIYDYICFSICLIPASSIVAHVSSLGHVLSLYCASYYFSTGIWCLLFTTHFQPLGTQERG